MANREKQSKAINEGFSTKNLEKGLSSANLQSALNKPPTTPNDGKSEAGNNSSNSDN